MGSQEHQQLLPGALGQGVPQVCTFAGLQRLVVPGVAAACTLVSARAVSLQELPTRLAWQQEGALPAKSVSAAQETALPKA